MSQIREIIVRPKVGVDIRAEFVRFLTTAREKRWDKLEVLFGFAWGSSAYENDWVEEILSPEELESRVHALEENQDGAIGGDDLFVTVLKTGVQYKFSHENQIHLEGFCGDPGIEAEVDRYRLLEWDLIERIEDNEITRKAE